MKDFNGRTFRRTSVSFSGESAGDPYLRMRGKLSQLLNKEKSQMAGSPPSPLDQLLNELEDFHEYYISKYAGLKSEYDAVCLKLAASEQSMGLEIDRLCVALHQTESERERLRLKIQPAFGGQSLHRFYETVQQSIKDACRSEAQQLQQEIRALKAKISSLSEQKAALQQKCEAATAESSDLKLKLREYQIERKYEAERINNSTFSLRVELASKCETVSRLQRELDLARGVRESESRSVKPGKEQVSDFHNEFTEIEPAICGTSRATLNILQPLQPISSEERTNRSQNLPVPKHHELTQKKQQKTPCLHRRHQSSTLNTSQEQICKVPFDKSVGHSELKIKIFRLEKAAKK